LIDVCVDARLPHVAAITIILFIVAYVITTAVAAVAAASWNALPAVGDGGQ
jgi:hypothetical protein